MAAYPGATGAFVPVVTPNSGWHLAKGESAYVIGQLATTATQLPINDTNVAFEAAPAGTTESSISVNIEGVAEGQPAPGIFVEIHTNGVPGAGESWVVQEADTDADAFYITPSNAAYTIATFNSNNVARSDLIPTGGKFVRVVRTKGANAVGATCKISRAA